MVHKGEHGLESAREREGGAPEPNHRGTDTPLAELVDRPQTPLYHAQHAGRYERQRLIEAYEREYDCRLVVMIDAIFAPSITYFEELIHDADPSKDLHLIIDSPGGDGETAVRLARSAQARCRRFTVIVPDQAKSAATILALGAHAILMGPTSDLGPVDPQLQLPTSRQDQWQIVAAKDLIAAVENAEAAVQAQPETYPLHASMLADVTEVMLQQARAALARTDDLVEQALRSQPDRSPDEVRDLKEQLREPLIDLPKDHRAILGAKDAIEAGLPVTEVDPAGLQWRAIWTLWSKYFVLPVRVYEGRRASWLLEHN